MDNGVCDHVRDMLIPLLEAQVLLPDNRASSAGRVLFDEMPVPAHAVRDAFVRATALDANYCHAAMAGVAAQHVLDALTPAQIASKDVATIQSVVNWACAQTACHPSTLWQAGEVIQIGTAFTCSAGDLRGHLHRTLLPLARRWLLALSEQLSTVPFVAAVASADRGDNAGPLPADIDKLADGIVQTCIGVSTDALSPTSLWQMCQRVLMSNEAVAFCSDLRGDIRRAKILQELMTHCSERSVRAADIDYAAIVDCVSPMCPELCEQLRKPAVPSVLYNTLMALRQLGLLPCEIRETYYVEWHTHMRANKLLTSAHEALSNAIADMQGQLACVIDPESVTVDCLPRCIRECMQVMTHDELEQARASGCADFWRVSRPPWTSAGVQMRVATPTQPLPRLPYSSRSLQTLMLAMSVWELLRRDFFCIGTVHRFLVYEAATITKVSSNTVARVLAHRLQHPASTLGASTHAIHLALTCASNDFLHDAADKQCVLRGFEQQIAVSLCGVMERAMVAARFFSTYELELIAHPTSAECIEFHERDLQPLLLQTMRLDPLAASRVPRHFSVILSRLVLDNVARRRMQPLLSQVAFTAAPAPAAMALLCFPEVRRWVHAAVNRRPVPEMPTLGWPTDCRQLQRVLPAHVAPIIIEDMQRVSGIVRRVRRRSTAQKRIVVIDTDRLLRALCIAL